MLKLQIHQTVQIALPHRKVPLVAAIRDYGIDGIWLMQKPSIISDCGSRESENTPLLRDGDIVWCKGQEQRVKIIGDFSDAGKLVPLNY